MPFQITIAIDPSRKIRKLMGKSLTKNENSESARNSGEATNSRSLEQCPPLLESSEKETGSETITLYRNHVLTDQEESDKEWKDSSTYKRNGDPAKREEISQKSISNPEFSYSNTLTVEPKTSIPGFFKKIFITNKKTENLSQTESAQTVMEQNRACGDAISAFNTLLEGESSLEALVGKAFSLNTIVTIQSIQDDGKPNLILTGSIPFQLTTKDGVVNKKLHVKGKLYSPRKEENKTESLIRIKINEQFKHDFSTLQTVSWLTSKIFTQEEYRNERLYPREQINELKLQAKGTMWQQQKFNEQETQERLSYFSDIDARESSVSVVGSGNINSNSNFFSTIDDRRKQLPVTSITIARSKTRLIRFSDGTDLTEKVGRKVVTLAAPEGILYFPEERSDEIDDSLLRRESMLGINCGDNKFTRSCFQMAKYDDGYFLSRSMPSNTKRFGQQRRKILDAEVKHLDPDTFYPPGNYSDILTDRYNPLTWIYHNFDKTKRFVREFKC